MINDLLVRYTTALDAGEVVTIVGCFTEDGALESPVVGVHAGRPAIRAFADLRFREGSARRGKDYGLAYAERFHYIGPDTSLDAYVQKHAQPL